MNTISDENEDKVIIPDKDKMQEALEDSDFTDAIIITWGGAGKEYDNFHVTPVTLSAFKRENGFTYDKLTEKLQRAIDKLNKEYMVKKVKHEIRRDVAEEL